MLNEANENTCLTNDSPRLYLNDRSDENETRFKANTSTIRELLFIARSSAPLIITFFLQYSLTVVSIFSVGHIGKTELAAVSLATMTFNVTVSIFNGMATCLDTFCAQAYGAKKHYLVGLYFQRCTAMIFVCSIPILFFWCFSASFLKLVVPEKNLAILAQTYLRYISFGAPGYILFETGKRFLQAQNIYTAGQYCLFFVAPLNVCLNYLLVWNKTFGMGFIGAPISTAISYWLMSLILLGYVIFVDGRNCWYGLQIKKAFNIRQWATMMSLALNGTVMLLSEFIAFEILTLSASRFGTSALAAQSVASTIATLSFQVPFGVSVAISTRIANYIGAHDLESAIIANKVAYMLAVIIGITNFCLLIGGRSIIANSFINDKKVVAIAVKVLTVLGINQLYDCANVIFAGCLRGQGRQKLGSSLNLIAYYIIAIPLALILAFKFGLGLAGLWYGLGFGILLLAISETWFVFHSDWREIAESSSKRNQE
jgi:MATE family multidrug resistance protein